MKKMKLENVLHSNGYVSIETLIVAGLIIVSGSFFISKLVWKGKDISVTSNNSLTNSKNILDDNSYESGTDGKDNNPSLPKEEVNFEYKIIDNHYVNSLTLLTVPGVVDSYKKTLANTLDINNLPTREEWDKYRIRHYKDPEPSEEELQKQYNDFIDKIKSNYDKFSKVKGNLVITKYTGTNKDVTIPATIDGKTVSIIGDMALSNNLIGANDNQSKYKDKSEVSQLIQKSNLSDEEIKECIKFIVSYLKTSPSRDDEFAIKGSTWINGLGEEYQDYFSNCIMYKKFTINSVVIPETVIAIGNATFKGNQISNVTMPSNIKWVGDYAFAQNKLTQLTIPNDTELGFCSFDRTVQVNKK